MKKALVIRFIFAHLFLMLPAIALAQFDIPEKPELQTAMYDYANILNGNDRQVLENKLVRYADSTSTQIVLITIESLKGESIGELTPKWAHEWGIGQADKDNGVLILLAKEERKIWIAPGYGVDDRLTAGVLGEMIRNVIIPEFKTGNYYTGLDKGADALFLMLKGKYKETRTDEYTILDYICKFLIWFIIIGFPLALLIFRFKSKDGWSDSSSSSSSSGSESVTYSSPSSGGKSSRGFRGGFGGGGFGGGGAGGSW
ncbi:TPM domain-containing protein [Flavobacterium sp. MFBS3-15]|uniref:TPM domain-containing protein n=1 Tax=Flavobacterium sp. MFBS3-15 TaxID=2989816 RepID=UPI0022354457|nr:TPM domain-containing protein [Flavobacterium sp. MFBS3-15]MCW4469535.1 TPM domain-containing protein [Flavobacterium sp. MFBS3-15]